MDKVKIKKTVKCDTRTLPKGSVVSEKDSEEDTLKHRQAVIDVGNYFCERIKEQFKNHDWSKLGTNLKDFTDGLNKGFDSPEFNAWYDMHVSAERHHLKKSVPDDVNIIDLLEMLIDCACAGMARTGSCYPMELDNELLQKVVAHTFELIKSVIEVED